MRRGYTLLELLVAIALSSMVVALLASVFVGALGVWEQSSGRTEVQREGQAVLASLTEDLQQAAPAGTGIPWLVCEVIPAAEVHITGAGQLPVSDTMRLSVLTRAVGVPATNAGGVNWLAFQVAHADPRPGARNPFYGLYRVTTSTAEFVENFRNGTPPGAGSPPPADRLNAEAFLARNVIAFVVWLQVEADNGTVSLVRAEPGLPLTVTTRGVFRDGTRVGHRVVSVDVSCLILPSKAAARMASLSPGDRAEWAERHARPFGGSIPLPLGL